MEISEPQETKYDFVFECRRCGLNNYLTEQQMHPNALCYHCKKNPFGEAPGFQEASKVVLKTSLLFAYQVFGAVLYLGIILVITGGMIVVSVAAFLWFIRLFK